MLETIKNLFGHSVDYKTLFEEGAIILDVRSTAEYNTGHIHESINIPVNELEKNLHRLKDKSTPIITCCASGMRSGAAKSMLISKGYETVHNGGGWASLNRKFTN